MTDRLVADGGSQRVFVVETALLILSHCRKAAGYLECGHFGRQDKTIIKTNNLHFHDKEENTALDGPNRTVQF